MSTLPIHRFTQAEYLRFEGEADSKHEFIDGQIYDMADASLRHQQIAGNLVAALHTRLRGKCIVYSSDTRVCIGQERLVSYPDVVVGCEPPKVLADDAHTLTNPSLLIDVLSPSTEAYDRGHKAAMFREMPSLRAYLLVAQRGVSVDYWERERDGSWSHQELTDPVAVIPVAPLGIEVPVSDIYIGIE